MYFTFLLLYTNYAYLWLTCLHVCKGARTLTRINSYEYTRVSSYESKTAEVAWCKLHGHVGSAVKVLVAIHYRVLVARNGYIRNVVV